MLNKRYLPATQYPLSPPQSPLSYPLSKTMDLPYHQSPNKPPTSPFVLTRNNPTSHAPTQPRKKSQRHCPRSPVNPSQSLYPSPLPPLSPSSQPPIHPIPSHPTQGGGCTPPSLPLHRRAVLAMRTRHSAASSSCTSSSRYF